MGKLQQKYAVDSFEETVGLPERDLFIAVLARAALDAFGRSTRRALNKYQKLDADDAINFLTQGGAHFNKICEAAGRDPVYVRERIRKRLLRNNGWNVDVPITSHYRKSTKINNIQKEER